MKKGIVFIILVLLNILVLAYTVSANTDNKLTVISLLDQQSFNNSDEKTQIQEVLNKEFPEVEELLKDNYRDFNIKTEDNVPVKYGEPYKVYKLKNTFIGNNGDIGKLIDSSLYFWEVPLFDANEEITNAIIVDKVKGEWKVVFIGLRLPPEVYEIYCNNEATFKNIPINDEMKEISQVIRVSDFFFFDGVFVKSGENQYMIPYTCRPDLLRLENGKVYSVDQITTKLSDMIDQFEVKMDDHE